MNDTAPSRHSVASSGRATTGGASPQVRDASGSSDDQGRGGEDASPRPDGGRPGEVLRALLEGNRRFLGSAPEHGHDVAEARRHAQEPRPAALIIGCIDSRVPPEVVLDQGVGDVLVVRTAAHVLDRAATASVELAVTAMGIPLIVVLGHEACAAVRFVAETVHNTPDAAHPRSGGRSEDLDYLVEQLASSVPPGPAALEPAALEAAERAHVVRTVDALRRLPAVAAAVAAGQLGVAGLRYAVSDGTVSPVVELDAAGADVAGLD